MPSITNNLCSTRVLSHFENVRMNGWLNVLNLCNSPSSTATNDFTPELSSDITHYNYESSLVQNEICQRISLGHLLHRRFHFIKAKSGGSETDSVTPQSFLKLQSPCGSKYTETFLTPSDSRNTCTMSIFLPDNRNSSKNNQEIHLEEPSTTQSCITGSKVTVQ